MEEPAFTSDCFGSSRIVIWGMGLMGGSLAMALKGKCAELVGIDANPDIVARALHFDIVQKAATEPGEVIRGADLIIFATPVRAILDLLAQLPEVCPNPAIVLDLGSTKREVVAAMDRLPERFDPIGGHPMCGKEKSSLHHADASLYHGAPFALTSLNRSSREARMKIETLVKEIGSKPLWLNADEHDQMVAATSHAPFLLASALAQATPKEARVLVGPGFRSTTRLAGSSTTMMTDILATNADYIHAAVEQIKLAINQYEAILQQGDFRLLAEILEESAARYRYLSGEV